MTPRERKDLPWLAAGLAFLLGFVAMGMLTQIGIVPW